MKKRSSDPVSLYRSNEDVKTAELIFAELIRLYRQSDPVHGAESAHHKDGLANTALFEAQHLVDLLVGWAVDHKSKGHRNHVMSRKSEDFSWDTHGHELTNFGWSDDVDVDHDVNSAEEVRAMLARLLDYGVISSEFGKNLAEDLSALNHGEVRWLMQPTKTGSKKSSGYTIPKTRLDILRWIYSRNWSHGDIGKNMAQVGEALGVAPDHVREWEKSYLPQILGKESVRAQLKEAKRLSSAVLCHGTINHIHLEYTNYISRTTCKKNTLNKWLTNNNHLDEYKQICQEIRHLNNYDLGSSLVLYHLDIDELILLHRAALQGKI